MYGSGDFTPLQALPPWALPIKGSAVSQKPPKIMSPLEDSSVL